jgi:hypothetical protein
VDSKQRYIVARHLSSTVIWQDWIHFGTGKDIKSEMIEGFIKEFLFDGTLNFVHDRQDSEPVEAFEVKEKIAGLLGQENFQLWNSAFTKVIDFNRIGVLKLGST